MRWITIRLVDHVNPFDVNLLSCEPKPRVKKEHYGELNLASVRKTSSKGADFFEEVIEQEESMKEIKFLALFVQ